MSQTGRYCEKCGEEIRNGQLCLSCAQERGDTVPLKDALPTLKSKCRHCQGDLVVNNDGHLVCRNGCTNP
jgi:hypothetical protein